MHCDCENKCCLMEWKVIVFQTKQKKKPDVKFWYTLFVNRANKTLLKSYAPSHVLIYNSSMSMLFQWMCFVSDFFFNVPCSHTLHSTRGDYRETVLIAISRLKVQINLSLHPLVKCFKPWQCVSWILNCSLCPRGSKYYSSFRFMD